LAKKNDELIEKISVLEKILDEKTSNKDVLVQLDAV
jgi:hypothetical protein